MLIVVKDQVETLSDNASKDKSDSSKSDSSDDNSNSSSSEDDEITEAWKEDFQVTIQEISRNINDSE